MPLTTHSSPWYQPDASYGATKAWRQTPFVQKYLDPQIPEGVYNSFIGERGFGGTDAESQYWQGKYGNLFTGYKSAMRANPNLSFRDFLGKQLTTGSMNRQYLGESPRARGENPMSTTGPVHLIDWG